MSEFTNITLLECSRNQSNQHESNDNNNNSIWTNRMGKTINLEIGDTIEVKSAYVNQRGCANPDSVEFKGEDLGVDILLEETTNMSPDVYTYEQIPTDWDASFDPQLNNYQQGNLGFRYINNLLCKKRLKDNVLHLEQNFYKNANGEETIMLPRSYNRKRATDIINTDAGFNNLILKVSPYWTYSDLDYDYNDHSKVYMNGENTGLPVNRVQNVNIDVKEGDPANQGLIAIFNTNDWECKFVQGDAYAETKIESAPTPPNPYTKSNCWIMKQRNDNSRFTLFEREFDFMIWSELGGTTASKNEDTLNPSFNITKEDAHGNDILAHKMSSMKWFQNDASIPVFDGTTTNRNFPPGYRRFKKAQPALCRYTKVSEIIDIELRKGFNSPEDVAGQITQTLQEQNKDSPVVYQKPEIAGSALTQEHYQNNFSIGIETPTFKPVLATTYDDFNGKDNHQLSDGSDVNLSNFQAYFYTSEPSEPSVQESKGAFEWWRAHHNIYVKRPDLFVAGRQINTRDCKVWNTGLDEFYGLSDSDLDLYQLGVPGKILNTINYDAIGINRTDKIITSFIWNKENLRRLKNLFDIQGKYPDLFSGIDKTYSNNQYLTNFFVGGDGSYGFDPYCTIDNSRFLHMNMFNEKVGHFEGLGDDDYNSFTYTETIDGEERSFLITHQSMPIFFYFDKNNRDKLTSGDDINDLCYGCFSKARATMTGKPEQEFICIHPDLLHGIRKEAFALRGGYGTLGWHQGHILPETTYIGWDWHWNSFGNLVLLKDVGTPQFDQGSNGTKADGTADEGLSSFIRMNEKFVCGTGGQVASYLSKNQINLTYIGTNNIACKYDADNKYFYFEYLHTPERIQNDWNSGLPSGHGSTATSVAIVAGQGSEVYKINKRLEGWTFCPDMCPYLNNDKFTLGSEATAQATDPSITINSFSQLIPWTIYDSHMGVNINFGKSGLVAKTDFEIPIYNTQRLQVENTSNKSQLEIWNNSVLGIMGFSFDQFNPKTILFNENGAQARVRYDNNDSLYNPTTNCQVVNTDVNQYIVSPWGAVQYGTQLPYQIILNQIFYTRFGEAVSTGKVDSPYFPAITEQTQSIKITGVNLPRVVLKPFYNIRTDVLSQDRYVGGINSGLAFPIIASVNRINAEKDYVQLAGSGEIFTITSPIKFSSITTAITDSDGKFGELDDGSVVIYKITKMDNLQNYNILAQIEQKIKKK
jgi:hypothetical protein